MKSRKPAIDAVLICSLRYHAELIVKAAEAGKHIFLREAIALSWQDRCRARAVEAAGVQLQIGFNRRFDANFVRVRHA